MMSKADRERVTIVCTHANSAPTTVDRVDVSIARLDDPREPDHSVCCHLRDRGVDEQGEQIPREAHNADEQWMREKYRGVCRNPEHASGRIDVPLSWEKFDDTVAYLVRHRDALVAAGLLRLDSRNTPEIELRVLSGVAAKVTD